ncbi:hypothetical protein QLF84_23860, partial [Salmonella enterica subsp. enterica serovar Oslo]
MDVGYANQTGDEEFLSTFIQVVEMAVNLHRPDLILYDAGVDIHNDDELGYLSVSYTHLRAHETLSDLVCRLMRVKGGGGGGG